MIIIFCLFQASLQSLKDKLKTNLKYSQNIFDKKMKT